MGVYSKSKEAGLKRVLDDQITGGRPATADFRDEAYLKKLIEAASKKKVTVQDTAKLLQFFLIEGGAEGFLDASYASLDASRIVTSSQTTAGRTATTVFDDNDLMAVFDQKGKLVSSALLKRPLQIPGRWTEATANKVYHSWDRKYLSLYHNKGVYLVDYYGLMIWDEYYKGTTSSGVVRIDFHKEEQTNGCIFIVDPNTPTLMDVPRLNAFEPQLIVDVQKAVGAKTKWNIGVLRMIAIK